MGSCSGTAARVREEGPRRLECHLALSRNRPEIRHLEIDHIIARGAGGTDHRENLQLLCSSCNRIKGDRGMEYLRTKLQL